MVVMISTTDLYIDYYCGWDRALTNQGSRWWLMLPAYKDCNFDGYADLLFRTHIHDVGWASILGSPTYFRLETSIEPVGSATGTFAVGVGLRGYTTGAVVDIRSPWRIHFTYYRDVHFYFVDLGVKWERPIGLLAGTKLLLTEGPIFTRGSTLSLVLDSQRTSHTASLRIMDEGTLTLWKGAGVGVAELFLEALPKPTIQVRLVAFPSQFQWKITTRSSLDAGDRTTLRLTLLPEVAYPAAEIIGELFEGKYYGDRIGTFHVQGMPARSYVSVDMGDGPDQIASIDVTKGSQTTAGHFRSLAFDGTVGSLRVQMSASDVARFVVVSGSSDPWDTDGDPFVALGANFVTSSGRAEANAAGPGGEYKGTLRVLDWRPPSSTYHWTIGPAPTCTVNCFGGLREGLRLTNDGLFFNGYMWAIAGNELDPSLCWRTMASGQCA